MRLKVVSLFGKGKAGQTNSTGKIQQKNISVYLIMFKKDGIVLSYNR